MPRLEDLRKNIEAMNPEELRAHLIKIRQDRRISKSAPKQPKVTKEKSAKIKNQIMSIMKGLSPEEVALLLGDQAEQES